ncbi:MAG: glycosyltransferase [Selenomonadaceae bacterium]|nr:glycosyltransferase [Selenomonadaceae bacterium]
MSPYTYLIPPNARLVAEIGAADQQTKQEFLQIQPDCRYLFFETGEDLQQLHDADCIFYRNRALQDPKLPAILKRHMDSLRENGQMIFQLENPGYFRRILGLMGGQLLTPAAVPLEVLKNMLEQMGLSVFGIAPFQVKQDEEWRREPETRGLLQSLERFAVSHGGVPFKQPWVQSYALRAVKGERPRSMLIQALLGESIVTSRIRVEEPLRFCATIPGVETQNYTKGVPLKTAEEYAQRVLLRQRIRFLDPQEARSTIRQVSSLGYLLLGEIDDSYTRWQDGYEASDYLDFVGMHAMQVSTEPLAEEIREFNPEVRVFRNHLEMLPALPAEKAAQDRWPVTIFFGALNREEEWQDIMPVLNQVAARYGDRLKFRVLADKQFYQALQTTQKEFIGRQDFYDGGFVPYPVYVDVLQSADISLLPLQDTVFNRGKSDLKFVESAAAGTVAIASPTVYEKTVEDGKTGFIYRDARQFREILLKLVEDRPLRRKVMEAAYDYVKHNRLLCQHYEERMDWYKELLAKRDELDKSLWKRVETWEARKR